MKTYILILTYLGCALIPTQAQNPAAKPIGFVEQWVLSHDRAATLKQLVPGTDNFYFFHALHYQQTQQWKPFQSHMKAWALALEKNTNLDHQRYQVMRKRGIILDYDRDPERSINKLVTLLKVRLDHKRTITPEEEDIPSTLDPAKISEEAFQRQAAKEGPVYKSYTDHLISNELKKAKTFDRNKRLWFLKETKRVDYPGIQQLILAELQEKNKPDFSKVPATKHLLLDQLIWLEKQHPALREHESFVRARLARTRPGDIVWQLLHPKETITWLEQSWKYSSALPPKHNSLKAHILYQLLDKKRQAGLYPANLFLEYLKLPRIASNPVGLQKSFAARYRCNMSKDFSDVTGASPVNIDNDLVIDYLYHILSNKDDASPYSQYFHTNESTRIHAQARLMAGADSAFWGGKLSPEAYRHFRDSTEVNLSLDNKKQWSSNDTVALQLDLKNTPKLTVRVFEIDALSHIRHTGNDPSADVKLNGLVPHHEETIEFKQAPLIRHRYTLQLPQLKGRGIWIAECISNGVSCRSLIRKGALQVIVRNTTTGQSATILDENQDPVHPATLWIKEMSYSTAKDGTIQLPFASSARIDQSVIHAPQLAEKGNSSSSGSGLAIATEVRRAAQLHEIEISAGSDREQLIAGNTATIFVRARLTCNGIPAPFSTIKEAKLHVRATLRGDINTELSDTSIKIPANGIITQAIAVPDDTRSITVSLSGEIQHTNKSEPVVIEDSSIIKINGVNDRISVAQPMLSLTKQGWRIDLLGRNGEPLTHRTLELEFWRRGFTTPVSQTLRTDAKGQIHLGQVTQLESVDIEATEFSSGLSEIFSTENFTGPDEIHAMEGEVIQFLALDPSWITSKKHYGALFRHNGDPESPVTSMAKYLKIHEGRITITNLPAGNYSLYTGEDTSPTPIRIINGKQNGIWLSDSSRTIEHLNQKPLWVANAITHDQTITARIEGGSETTQIMAIGSRYHREYEHFNMLWVSHTNTPARWTHAYLGNETMNGNTLSDEYRYILERRQAKQYPGSMLLRPGIILNRWKMEDSNIYFGTGAGGSNSLPSAMRKRSKREGGTRDLPPAPPANTSPSLDFLSNASVIKTNLTMAKDGSVTIPLADFKNCQKVTMIAISQDNLATRSIALNPSPLLTRERRLDRNLDPKKHYIGNQATAILRKGAKAEIKNVLDADWRAYTELAHVYDYFHANNGSPQLRDFVHTMQWPQLTKKQRLGASQLLASHEFHLFAYFKDRKWFNTNIKPILINKRHRTFIDDFLLGNNLKPYLSPWRYQNLNAAEKALLARALPEHRAAIVQDLTHQYEISKPTPELETRLFASALKQNSLALRDRLGFASRDLARLEKAERRYSGVHYLQQKINSTIIPILDFENTTIGEAVDFLSLRTRELSVDDSGLNFLIKGKNISNLRIDELKLKNVPLGTALQYICDKARLRYRLSPYAIELLPLASLEANDLYTRNIVVSPDFLARLSDSGVAGSDDDDPFGGGSEEEILPPRTSAKELLMNNGISFPDSSFVVYNPQTSTITIRNSLQNLDMIESITESIRCSGSREQKTRFTTLNKPSGEGSLREFDDDGDDPFGGGDATLDASAGGPFGGDSDGLSALPPEPEDLLTHIWSESNYYRHEKSRGVPTINPSKFWIEFAKHDGKSPFLSAWFTECNDSTASMLIALAVLDLPFKGEKPEATIDNLTLTVKAKSPMLLFYRDVRETEKVADSTPLLVRQNFFRHGDRTRIDPKGRKIENTITGDFLTRIPYTASLIITNPTGTPRELQVLTQIPRGAIALMGHPSTESLEIRLDKHATTRVEYSFYFPAAGSFPHYPAHVLEEGIVQASAKAITIKVLDQPEQHDTRSWSALARDGSDDEVLARLSTANLQRTPLHPILWRLSKQTFYQKLVTLLNQRLHFNGDVFAYGMKYGDQSAVRIFLENQSIADELGAHFDSKLLTIDGRERGQWEHLEFAPLVNERRHAFQGHHQILNQQAKEQYLTILDSIAWKSSPTQDDLLTLTYHLFLQDRIGEALRYFSKIKRDQVVTKMQYDYLHCYALFYQEKPTKAAAIAAKWKTTTNGYWRGLFQTVTTQAAEIAKHHVGGKDKPGKPVDPDSQTYPSLTLEPAQGHLSINYQGITKASLRLYAVDLEVLFSESPFLDSHGDLNPSIRPNKSIVIDLPKDKKQHIVNLPDNLNRGNVLAMVESGKLRKVIALDSNAIQINRRISDKSLTITKSPDGSPAPRCYVKIYIEKTDGNIQFYKDGYTDLRGMFPYEAHTQITPDQIKRYAIFVSHPKLGSKILTTR